jgi:hypothetical protein
MHHIGSMSHANRAGSLGARNYERPRNRVEEVVTGPRFHVSAHKLPVGTQLVPSGG